MTRVRVFAIMRTNVSSFRRTSEWPRRRGRQARAPGVASRAAHCAQSRGARGPLGDADDPGGAGESRHPRELGDSPSGTEPLEPCHGQIHPDGPEAGDHEHPGCQPSERRLHLPGRTVALASGLIFLARAVSQKSVGPDYDPVSQPAQVSQLSGDYREQRRWDLIRSQDLGWTRGDQRGPEAANALAHCDGRVRVGLNVGQSRRSGYRREPEAAGWVESERDREGPRLASLGDGGENTVPLLDCKESQLIGAEPSWCWPGPSEFGASPEPGPGQEVLQGGVRGGVVTGTGHEALSLLEQVGQPAKAAPALEIPRG